MKRIAAVLALAAAAFILFPLSRPAAHAPGATRSHVEAATKGRHRSGPAVLPLIATIPAPPPIEARARMVDGFALEAQLRGGLEAAADDSALDVLPPVAVTPQRVAPTPVPPIPARAVTEPPPRAKPEGASDDEGS